MVKRLDASASKADAERHEGSTPSRPTKATMETASKQSAKLPSAGSTPAVASYQSSYQCILVMPAWWWKIAGETWLSLRSEPLPEDNSVWVFNVIGEHLFFPWAIFSSRSLAEDWIMEKRPIGILTKYVLDKPDDSDFPEHYHYQEEDDYVRRVT